MFRFVPKVIMQIMKRKAVKNVIPVVWSAKVRLAPNVPNATRRAFWFLRLANACQNALLIKDILLVKFNLK